MIRIAIALVAVVAAVAAAGYGFVALDERAAPPIVIEDPRPDATVVVAVEGAVASPGVYALPGDARTADALAAAGGVAEDADLAAVNLARRLRDEERIVVPTLVPRPMEPELGAAVDAPPPVAGPGDVPATATVSAPTLPVGAIDVNTATAEELDALPGIGPVLAERIIARRSASGPYRSVEDLEEVPGISATMVDDLRPLITVGP